MLFRSVKDVISKEMEHNVMKNITFDMILPGFDYWSREGKLSRIVETNVSSILCFRRKMDGGRKYFYMTYGRIKYMFRKTEEAQPQIKRKTNKFHAITKPRVSDDYNERQETI